MVMVVVLVVTLDVDTRAQDKLIQVCHFKTMQTPTYVDVLLPKKRFSNATQEATWSDSTQLKPRLKH